MSDLQNKSDWLAEFLLGWTDAPGSWQPHEKIEQCFAYIIPAMEKLGYGWNVVKEPDIDERAGANFWINGKDILHHAEDENPAAAIVEAAYAALQKELK